MTKIYLSIFKVLLFCTTIIYECSSCSLESKKKLLIKDLNILEMLEKEVKVQIESLNLKETFKKEVECPYLENKHPITIIAQPPPYYPPQHIYSPPPIPIHPAPLPCSCPLPLPPKPLPCGHASALPPLYVHEHHHFNKYHSKW